MKRNKTKQLSIIHTRNFSSWKSNLATFAITGIPHDTTGSEEVGTHKTGPFPITRESLKCQGKQNVTKNRLYSGFALNIIVVYNVLQPCKMISRRMLTF